MLVDWHANQLDIDRTTVANYICVDHHEKSGTYRIYRVSP